MATNGNIACIDIGSTKICVLVANVSDRNIVQILGVGIAPALGIQRGLVIDLDNTKRSLQEALEKAERSSGLRVSQAYIGFSGKHVSSLNNRVAVAIPRNDHLVTQATLRQGLVSVHKITLPQGRTMMHVIPRRYFLDGVSGIRNPLGMHGYRLDLEAHIITAGSVHIQNLMECLQATGVAIEGLVVGSLASAETVLEPEDRDDGVILADIGGGTTDIAVFNEGSVWHTSTLPVGGIQVTKDIAAGLGIPFSVAEELKLKHGSLLTEDEGNTISVTSDTNERYSVSQEDLCYIIKARVEEILRMIPLEIPRSEYEPSTIVITGGTSNLIGIEEFAQQVTGLNVRIGTPMGLPDNAESLMEPMYATSVGLLQWGASQQDDGERLDLTSSDLTVSLRRFFARLRSIRLPRLPRITFENTNK